MYVTDILRSKGARIVSVSEDDSVNDAIGLLCSNRIGAVLVLDKQGGLAGILSERDLVRGLQRHGKAVFDKPITELMTTQVITCSPGDPVASIEGLMTANRFRHVPVMENNQLVGVISIGDVVKNRIEEAQAEVDALRRYISL